MDEIGEDQEILINLYTAQQERSVALGIYLMRFGGALADKLLWAMTKFSKS